MPIIIKQTLLAIVLSVLVGCGYHMRGAMEMPEGVGGVYLDNASPALRSAFVQAFAGSQVAVVDSLAKAGFVLKVLSERMDRRVLTLTNTGKANEFELRYTLDYQITDAQNKLLVDTQSLSLTRDYFNDQLAIIAKTDEEQVLSRELYQRAVQQIVSVAQARLKGS